MPQVQNLFRGPETKATVLWDGMQRGKPSRLKAEVVESGWGGAKSKTAPKGF